MALSVSVPGVQRLDERVWKARLSPAEARILGSGSNTYGSISIILLTEKPLFDESRSSLSFNPSSVHILNLGTTNQALFITGSEEQEHTAIHNPHGVVEGKTAAGDAKFLDDLPSHLNAFGSALLSEIRTHFPGELKYYPRSGKFVETPDNFWTVRIQTRDRSFRITVRGRPDTFQKSRTLGLKPDMTGYSSFKVSSASQIPEVLEILKQIPRK